MIAYIRVIKNMYEGVQIQGGKTHNSPIIINLYQGLVIIPFHYTMMFNVLTEYTQELALRYMIFEDGIILIRDLKE